VGRVHFTGVGGLGPFRSACEAIGDRVYRRVLVSEGVPAALVEDAQSKIPLRAMFGLFDAAARAAGDELFGFWLGESMQPDDFGAWAQYAASGENLDEVIRRAARTVHYHQPGAILAREDRGDRVGWSMTAAVRQQRGHIQHSDHLLAPMLRAVRAYTGADWLPDRIEVDYPRPVHWQRLEEALGAPLRFDAPKVSLVFPKTLLERPALRRPPLAASVTLSDLRRIVANRAPRTTAEAIREVLVFGKGSGNDLDGIARLLRQSRRSLQRDLQSEGTSFRDILAQARLAEAQRLLSGADASIEEIAWHLGYGEHPHFTRAFRNLLGMSPRAYRERFGEPGASAAA
jgi:AraC-like DNA-binding protein